MDAPALQTYQPVKLSRNLIIVGVPAVVQPGLVDRSGLRYFLQVKTPISYQSSTFAELTTLQAFEEPSETIAGVQNFPGAKFEVQDQVDGLLKLVPPVFGQESISVCPDLTTQFVTKAIRKNGDDEIDEIDHPAAWILKGGIDERYFAEWGDRLFTEVSGMAGRFFTWKPDNARIRPDQPEYLYFLTNMTPTPSQLRLRVKAFYDDGTDETFIAETFAGVTSFSVYCIPVGPRVLGLGSLAKVVDSYQVWLNNEADARISEIRTYRIDTRVVTAERFILFNGSLGNFDSLQLIGKGSESLKVVRQMVDRYPDDEMLPTYAERVINNVTGERELTISTGWLTKTQAEYLSDLFFARQIFLVTDREHIPLYLVTDSIVTQEDERDLIGFTFTFQYTNTFTGYARLPIAPARIERQTAWRPFDYGSCTLDANGKRTGFRKVSMLEKYFVDSGQAVDPQQLKPNIPGTEGYIDSILSPECANTPFLNAKIERSGTYLRANCGAGYTGGAASIVIAAGKYGSELSQLDADAKAEAEFQQLNTQAYADAYGVCLTGPEFYTVDVPAGRVNFRFSPNLAGKNSFVAGGNTSSGDNSVVIYSNGWPFQGNTNPASIIYPVGANDIKLPSDQFVGFNRYKIGIYGTGTLNVYLNGTKVYTAATADYTAHQPVWPAVPDKALVYIELA